MLAIHNSEFVDDRGCEIDFFQGDGKQLIFQVWSGCESANVALSVAQVEMIRDQLTEWLDHESCGS